VRPKSREETPKEGSEANERVASLAWVYVNVRRTKCKGKIIALQKRTRGMASAMLRAQGPADIKEGPLA
jgi:hypothetical protein